MDFPHRFRPARFRSDARARARASACPRAVTLPRRRSASGCAPADRRRSPSASWMDPWGRTASAGSSPKAFQGGWTAHAAPSDESAANPTPLSWPPDQPPRVNNRASGRGFRGRGAYATSRITASSSGGSRSRQRTSRHALHLRIYTDTSKLSLFTPRPSVTVRAPVSLYFFFISPFFFCPRTRSRRRSQPLRGVRATARFALNAPPHGNQEGASGGQECD